ncbi:MAG TPA: hypothetical protein VGM84_27055 [Steroidobacteraceae bacterium]|jgi:hypothetical protein
MSRFLPLVLVAGLTLTPAVFAANDPMDACSKETNDSARLACFDKAIAARRKTPSAPSAATPTTPTAATAATAATAPAVSSGTNAAQRPTNTALPPDLGKPVRPVKVKPVEYSATLTKVDARSSTGYLLVLDNGQVWETTEARSDLLLNAQDRVTIRPAGAGGFLLKTPRKQIVRVVRIQ